MSEGVISKYRLTGICEINIPKLIKSWKENFRWQVYQYNDTYKLLKLRKGGNSLLMKICISKEQAEEIIKLCNLTKVPHVIFSNSFTYIKE